MSLTSPESRASDARLAARSSLYLGAALYCDGSSTPARIRNISTGGALVEAAVVPEVGDLVQLVRGTLIVHGLVIWSEEDRCGLKFSGAVDVQQWRSAPTNHQQQRVDELVRLVKAGAVPLPVAGYGEPRRGCGMSATSEDMAADLRRVTELLDNLADVLAADPDVVVRHGIALQNLDISTQVIAALQATVTGRDHEASDGVKLAALRRSADQAIKQR
jgi:hypothetical protein